MADKVSETVGGIDHFDQVQALVLERLRQLPGRKDLPNAFVIAIPTITDGQAAVELITCCPTDQETELIFMTLTLSNVWEWANEIKNRWQVEGEDE